ncbi:MAG: 16S rRNA (adenine(1518)-N(6)/adenine(1519)-N(6))-dimethyltransferase RsmA [Ruminococcus sp.]|nr:16S rRNA (adenine(1518)-N(6)/adenine(1519)-N(6))-dimethyltransferase RsmA [Ruminococcus sp.]
MERLTNISTVRQILSRHGFTFSKALGQNFLINPTVCPRMADFAVTDDNMGVLEIGPGVGVLTNELCARAKKVVAVELDKRLIPVLSETLGEYDNLKVINADVMELDLNALIAEEFPGMRVAVCANLPYYITSPILMKLLEDRLPVETITVMVQKEAALRLCAEEGTRDSSAITAAVRYYAEPELLFHVSAGSFMPAPKVDSAVIRLTLREPEYKPMDEKLMFRIIKAAFAQRRKTVLNAIASGMSLDKSELSGILEEAGVAPTARAEKLTLRDYARIADVMTKGGNNG